MNFPSHIKEALNQLCRELVGVESRMSDDALTREALPGIGEELRALGTKVRDLMAEEPWLKSAAEIDQDLEVIKLRRVGLEMADSGRYLSWDEMQDRRKLAMAMRSGGI